jgi:hypothetical protein
MKKIIYPLPLLLALVACGTRIHPNQQRVSDIVQQPVTQATSTTMAGAIPTPVNNILAAATSDPKVALRESIIHTLGTNDKKLPRLIKISYSTPEAGDITIAWEINDHELPNTTKVNAQIDAANILKILEKSETRFIYVILIGTISTQDKFGHVDEMQVISLGFNKSKLDKINWDNFKPSDIYDLADVADVRW